MMDLHIEEETYMKYCIGIDLGGTTMTAGLVNEKFEVVGVYTKPDMPKNRGMKLVMFRRKLRKRLA